MNQWVSCVVAVVFSVTPKLSATSRKLLFSGKIWMLPIKCFMRIGRNFSIVFGFAHLSNPRVTFRKIVIGIAEVKAFIYHSYNSLKNTDR
jgi:hypothetical protein